MPRCAVCQQRVTETRGGVCVPCATFALLRRQLAASEQRVRELEVRGEFVAIKPKEVKRLEAENEALAARVRELEAEIEGHNKEHNIRLLDTEGLMAERDRYRAALEAVKQVSLKASCYPGQFYELAHKALCPSAPLPAATEAGA